MIVPAHVNQPKQEGGIPLLTSTLPCVVALHDRMNHSCYLLTCIEVSVFGELLCYSVNLFGIVVTTVAVKLDTGREVHHQPGQGGDLLQNRLILLQQGGHVSCGRAEKTKQVKSTFLTPLAATFKVSC